MKPRCHPPVHEGRPAEGHVGWDVYGREQTKIAPTSYVDTGGWPYESYMDTGDSWPGDYANLSGKKVAGSVPIGNLEKVIRETLLEMKRKTGGYVISHSDYDTPYCDIGWEDWDGDKQGRGVKKGYVDVYSDFDGPYHDTGWADQWSGDTWRDWGDWNDSNNSGRLRKREAWSGDGPYYDTVSYHDYPGYYDRP